MRSRIAAGLLRLFGWKTGMIDPGTGKYVIIAAPHTSNWDFPLGILAAWALRLKLRWIGKHTLFRPPFGWFFRMLGGTPVFRSERMNLSRQLAEKFAAEDHFILALAPEGTRSYTDHWKTGFYYIALEAGVPVVLGYLDYGKREVGTGKVLQPSGDIEADFEIIREFYADRRGKYPRKESAIRIRKRN